VFALLLQFSYNYYILNIIYIYIYICIYVGPLIIGALTQSLGAEAYLRVVTYVVNTSY
jgi:hypothetical protein